ncbi:hypothetical protein MXB_2102 [Myxobolus squamalis]|nr:hypothetical protein MXB_2102 [Myxobolus squamalis]
MVKCPKFCVDFLSILDLYTPQIISLIIINSILQLIILLWNFPQSGVFFQIYSLTPNAHAFHSINLLHESNILDI